MRKLATELRSAGDEAKAGLHSQLLQAAEHFERAGAAAAGFRAQLAPIKEHAHESESALGGLKERALEVAAVFGVGFGLERIVEEFVQLAEKAEHMENVAASIGVGVGEFAQIGGAIQIATGNADVAARTFQMLERNIRNALETPTGTQGRAFEALKISADELTAGLQKPAEFLDVLANRWERFVTNSDTPAAGVASFRDILGRGMSELVPALARGAEHFRELKKEAGELTGFTEENIKHLAETAEEINKINLAWTGMKVAIYESFRDPVNESIGAVKELLENSRDVVSTINEAIKLRATFGGAAAGAAVGGVVAGVPGALVGGTAGAIVGFGTDLERQSPEEAAKRAVRVPENIERRLEGGASAPLPPKPATEAERAFLDEAKQRESGGRYDILHYPAAGQSGIVSSLADVDAASVTKNSHAFGAYGFQPGTYREMAAVTGRSDISRESQDINALELYRERGTKPWPWAAKGEGGAAAGEGGKERAQAPNYKEIEKDYNSEIKVIDERRKALLDFYNFEIDGAKGNQEKIRVIEAQQEAVERQAIAERQKARDEALAKAKPGSLGYEDVAGKIVGPGTGDKDRDEQIHLADAALKRDQRAQEEAARLEITKLETQRKVADQQEQTKLQQVEGERRTGELSIDAAAQAEQQIVQKHADKVAEILAQEEKQAQGIEKLATEVSNREIEQFTKTAEAKTRIDQRAEQEHAARAHAIDAELASAASGLIVNTAWGKGGGIGQQIAGFVQGQEKKALDAVGTRLLDASSIGKLFEGIGDKLFSFLPGAVSGAASGAAANAPVVATITAQTPLLVTGITTPIVAAITASAGTGAAGSAAGAVGSAASGGGSFLSGLSGIVGSLFGGGGAVAGIGGAAALSSGTSALDALVPTLLEAAPLLLEEGGVIPSAAGGMTVNDGKGGTVAIVHPNEMVLPAPLSLGIQDMINRGGVGWSIPRAPAPNAVAPAFAEGGSGGGGDTHNHSWNINGVLNTNDVQRLLMTHSETIAKAQARASRNFDPNAR